MFRELPISPGLAGRNVERCLIDSPGEWLEPVPSDRHIVKILEIASQMPASLRDDVRDLKRNLGSLCSFSSDAPLRLLLCGFRQVEANDNGSLANSPSDPASSDRRPEEGIFAAELKIVRHDHFIDTDLRTRFSQAGLVLKPFDHLNQVVSIVALNEACKHLNGQKSNEFTVARLIPSRFVESRKQVNKLNSPFLVTRNIRDSILMRIVMIDDKLAFIDAFQEWTLFIPHPLKAHLPYRLPVGKMGQDLSERESIGFWSPIPNGIRCVDPRKELLQNERRSR